MSSVAPEPNGAAGDAEEQEVGLLEAELTSLRARATQAAIEDATADALQHEQGTPEANEAMFQCTMLKVACDVDAVIEEGLKQLQALENAGYKVEDCQFWRAWGLLNAGQPEAAVTQVGELTKSAPSNERAALLREVIRRRCEEEGRKGLVIIGAVALGVVVGAYFLYRYLAGSRASAPQAPTRVRRARRFRHRY